MASRIIFDPLVALRLAPLISSTCSLWSAWDQHVFLSVFVTPQNRSFADQYLPTYFRTLFRSVAWVVVLLGLTLSTAGLNIATDAASLRARQSLHWYAAGAVFAVGHVAFAPIVMPKVRHLGGSLGWEANKGSGGLAALEPHPNAHR